MEVKFFYTEQERTLVKVCDAAFDEVCPIGIQLCRQTGKDIIMATWNEVLHRLEPMYRFHQGLQMEVSSMLNDSYLEWKEGI